MRELDTVVMQQCTSLSQHVYDVGGYVQTGLFNERQYPECTCLAYKFSKRTENFGGTMYPLPCKHIREIENGVCGWHQQWSDEPQIEDGVCPRCGKPTELVRVTV